MKTQSINEERGARVCEICLTDHGRSKYGAGADNDCCPQCKHYNALLWQWRGDFRVHKCRDCGFEAEWFDPTGKARKAAR